MSYLEGIHPYLPPKPVGCRPALCPARLIQKVLIRSQLLAREFGLACSLLCLSSPLHSRPRPETCPPSPHSRHHTSCLLLPISRRRCCISAGLGLAISKSRPPVPSRPALHDVSPISLYHTLSSLLYTLQLSPPLSSSLSGLLEPDNRILTPITLPSFFCKERHT